MVVDEVAKAECYVIYGAQVVAVGAYTAINHLTGIKPICFAVASTEEPAIKKTNRSNIDGIEVKTIEKIPKNVLIVVAVTELIQKEVLPFLYEKGFRNVYPLTAHEEHLLMSKYFNGINEFPLVDRDITTTDERSSTDLMIYEVMNDRDKIIHNHPTLFSYERPIQAGAILADHYLVDCVDCTGDNISAKNRMYCEMTAVYWVWKNMHHDWVGIEHYRRHLLVKPEMINKEIDAIMPLPYICYLDEVAQFRRFVSEDVLSSLLSALEKLHPSEFEKYRSILYGRYQYTYNLMCVRWDVFDDYCSWFFEITEYMEKNSNVSEIQNTRALSYVAEVLTNIYYMSHQDSLRIRHVEKEIYV